MADRFSYVIYIRYSHFHISFLWLFKKRPHILRYWDCPLVTHSRPSMWCGDITKWYHSSHYFYYLTHDLRILPHAFKRYPLTFPCLLILLYLYHLFPTLIPYLFFLNDTCLSCGHGYIWDIQIRLPVCHPARVKIGTWAVVLGIYGISTFS